MPVEPNQINLSMQIDCVKREIAMRQQVYPGLVGRGKMKAGQADIQIAAMQAVLQTLYAEQERRVGAAVGAMT